MIWTTATETAVVKEKKPHEIKKYQPVFGRSSKVDNFLRQRQTSSQCLNVVIMNSVNGNLKKFSNFK